MTSWPPAATTGSSARPPASRSATVTCGWSPASAVTARSPCPTSADTAPSCCPCDYVRDHVRLGYAATEHGNQADTVDVGIQLVSPATTCRGLYVGATRGREENRIHVVTESADPAEARDVLEAVLAYDRADVPAVTQRRTWRPDSPPRRSASSRTM